MVRSFAKTLLSIFLLSTTAYAVDMDGKLEIYAPIELEVKRQMVLPSVFVDYTGVITSEDSTSIPSGHNGTNAIVCLNGEPNKQYSLNFKEGVLIFYNKDEINVSLKMGTGSGNMKNRKLSTAGGDCATIRGEVTLTGQTIPGHYVNNTGGLQVDAVYDSM